MASKQEDHGARCPICKGPFFVHHEHSAWFGVTSKYACEKCREALRTTAISKKEKSCPAKCQICEGPFSVDYKHSAWVGATSKYTCEKCCEVLRKREHLPTPKEKSPAKCKCGAAFNVGSKHGAWFGVTSEYMCEKCRNAESESVVMEKERTARCKMITATMQSLIDEFKTFQVQPGVNVTASNFNELVHGIQTICNTVEQPPACPDNASSSKNR